MKAVLVTLLLVFGSCSCMAQKVFKGKWMNSEENIVLCLNLYEKTVTIPEMDDEDQTPSYGYLSTVYPVGFRMDMDQIESSTINGNTAIVVFKCGRMDVNGKAKLVYNPTDGSIKISILEAPVEDGLSDCYAQDITLKKAR